MVGSSGSTTPNVASTTASQPKMINNPRVMRLFAPQSVAAYCSIGAAPAEYACGACFTAGSRASLRLLKSRGSLCEHSASITGVGTADRGAGGRSDPARRCANPAGALRRRPVRQPRHAAARLPAEVEKNFAQLQSAANDSRTSRGLSGRKLVAQIAALQRELATRALRRKNQPKEAPEADLYHKLAEHQDYERRLIGMIQDRESLLGRQTTLAAQQKLQHELAALEGRLMRCRRAGAHRTQYRAQRKRFLKIYHNILMIIPGCAPGSLYSAGTRVIHPIN